MEQSDKSLQECLPLTDGFNSVLLSMECAVFMSLADSLAGLPFLLPYFFILLYISLWYTFFVPEIGKKCSVASLKLTESSYRIYDFAAEKTGFFLNGLNIAVQLSLNDG